MRADRQPEFTQLDMEVAFMDRDAVMGLMEQLIATVFREVCARAHVRGRVCVDV